MKKRAFFLTSLLSAIAALLAQAAGFYFVLLAVSEATTRMMVMLQMPPFIFGSQMQPTAAHTFYWVVSVLLLSGLVLALFSLVSVVVSFRRREQGWRFVSVLLLTFYAGTWGMVLYDKFVA